MIFSRSFDVRVGQYLTPEASDLMGIVDLHHIELLDDLMINLDLLLLELRNYLLTQVDCHHIP